MNPRSLAVACGFAALVGAVPATARAREVVVVTPERGVYDHPAYTFESEPHFLFGYAGPFDADHGPAIGFHGTFNLLDRGFIDTINDSVGLGVGADFAGDAGARFNVNDRVGFTLRAGYPGLSAGLSLML